MNNEQKFLDMLSSFDTAMLVTQAEDGHLSARPMAVARAEADGDLWFVTDQNSGKMVDLEANPNVCVTMQSSSQYVSMCGRASSSKNHAKIGELWQEKWKIWFPGGKNDPKLMLIQVVPTKGEYWDNSGLEGLQYLFEAGKAYLQGTSPDIDNSINAKVTLESTWIE